MSGAGRDSWDSAEVWSDARARAREEVREAFAPQRRVCRNCGNQEVTARRACSRCGVAYVELRDPGMSRRARRRARIAVALTLIALVGAGFAIVPSVQHAKRSAAARDRAQTEASIARERRRLAIDQRLHAAVAPGSHARLRGLPAARRAALLRADLEAAITADTRARVRSHLLPGPILRTDCTPVGGSGGPPVGRYSCEAVNAQILRATRAPAGSIGYPFWARIDFRHLAYRWCKINPRAGEGSATPAAVALVVPVPRGCDISG
jgi:hypothetical protein